MKDELESRRETSPLRVRGPGTCGLVLLLLAALIGTPVRAEAQGTSEPFEDRYEHETVFPFSFGYPRDWNVQHSNPPVPAYHWVMAAPESGGSSGISLRVTAIGHAPSLVGRKDASKIIVETLEAELALREEKSKVEVGEAEEIAFANFKGMFAPYRHLNSESKLRGRLLWIVVDGSALIADFQWRNDADDAAHEKTARAIAESFQAEFSVAKAETKRPESDPIVQRFSHPKSWSLTKIRTGDRSKAVQLESPDGLELVMRSIARKKGATALDRKALLSLAESLLVDQMRVISKDDLQNVATLTIAGGGEGLGLYQIVGQRGRQALIFERGGSAHVVFIDLPGGWQGRSWGQAMQIVASLRGAEDVQVPPAFGALQGKFRQRRVLRRPSFQIYDDRGLFSGGRASELVLLPNGRFRWIDNDNGRPVVHSGKYQLDGSRLRIETEAGKKLDLRLDTTRKLATSKASRSWIPIPDLH